MDKSLDARELLVLEAGRPDAHYWRDLWRYRELFCFLAWRDVSVRYKQATIGIAWAVLRPLLTMAVFTVVFSKFARLPDDGVPYPLLVMTGMLPWFLFSSAWSESGTSLVANSNLLTKVYFPRLIVPFSAAGVALVDFMVSMVLLAGLLLWFGVAPGWRLLALPLLTVLAIAPALGLGLWFSALNVKYRDFQYAVPFLLQLGLYASPVGFSTSVVPEQWRPLYTVNPMVGVIEGFRWAVLPTDAPFPADALAMTLAVSAVLIVTGVRYFRRTERSFADVV
jgi:lipopolysaccharide transport system permease protein